MIIINTLINIIDNSGVKQIKCIGFLNKTTKKITPGNIIVGVVKKIKQNSLIKISSIVRALIVTSKNFININDGSYIKFINNSAILLNKKNIPIGTRVIGSFYYKKLYYKLLKLNAFIL